MSLRVTRGLWLALSLALCAGTAEAQTIPVAYATVSPNVDLRQYANLSAPTPIAVHVNAQLAGGDAFGNRIQQAVADRLNGAGYQAVSANMPHRVTVDITFYGAPVQTQTGGLDPVAESQRAVNLAVGASVLGGLLKVPETQQASATYSVYAMVSITVDGTPVSSAMVNAVSPARTPQEALAELDQVFASRVASIFTGLNT